ncbi:MAG: LysR family transcriptional regulator [Pseudomonadota bacterium]
MDKANIRHLIGFAEAVRLRSISGAAASVGRTQPALSHAIHTLEDDFGASLFHRGRAGVTSTEAGNALAIRVTALILRLRNAFADALKKDRDEAQRIVHGLTSGQLRALFAVDQQQSFAGGARAFGIPAPNLHRSINELEQKLGVELFEKANFGARSTQAGAQLAFETGLAFRELRQARDEIARIVGAAGGETRIGAMPFARAYIAPMATTLFLREYPNYNIAIIEAPYEVLVRDLRRGAVDFLIGAERGEMSGAGTIEERILQDELSLLMRPDHPLMSERVLSRKVLAVYPWITPRISSPLRRQVESLLGAAPVSAIECNSYSAARIVLMNSDTLMLLSKAQARLDIDSGLISARTLPGKKLARSIVLSYRSDWNPTERQSALLQQVRSLAATSSSSGHTPRALYAKKGAERKARRQYSER